MGKRTSPRPLLGLAAVVVAVAPWSWAAVANAASPSTGREPSFGTVQAWLDAPFAAPPDMRPGGTIEIGMTFWDPRSHDLIGVSGVVVRLLPAMGKATPTVGTVQSDWPGHIVVQLTAPEGGPGTLEFGLDNGDGTTLPFKPTGTGPPPDAPLTALLSARFHPFVGDIVAGREFPVGVDLIPQGFWEPDAIPLADGLIVSARHPGGPELAAGALRQQGQAGTPYTGRLQIPETGDVELTVAIPVAGFKGNVIPGSATRVTVVEGGPRGSQDPAAPVATAGDSPTSEAPAGEIPLAVWLGVGLLAVVIVGLVARRALADL